MTILIRKDMDRAKAEASLLVNVTSGMARERFITNIPGQEMIYLRKESEARAYVAQINAGQTPNMADYKFMTMEIGITAPDAWQLAQVWLNRSALWEIVGSTIEYIRLGTLGTIAVATCPADIDAALSAFGTGLTVLDG